MLSQALHQQAGSLAGTQPGDPHHHVHPPPKPNPSLLHHLPKRTPSVDTSGCSAFPHQAFQHQRFPTSASSADMSRCSAFPQHAVAAGEAGGGLPRLGEQLYHAQPTLSVGGGMFSTLQAGQLQQQPGCRDAGMEGLGRLQHLSVTPPLAQLPALDVSVQVCLFVRSCTMHVQQPGPCFALLFPSLVLLSRSK